MYLLTNLGEGSQVGMNLGIMVQFAMYVPNPLKYDFRIKILKFRYISLNQVISNFFYLVLIYVL